MTDDIRQLHCDAAQAVELLKGLWELNSDGKLRIARHMLPDVIPWYSSAKSLFALAGSEFDQRVMGGTDNPLWEIVRWFPAKYDTCGCTRQPKIGAAWIDLRHDAYERLYHVGIERYALCTEYAFSIISPGDVAWISRLVAGRSVVELGAGRGYWAWQLEQAGLTVHAFEPRTPGVDNEYLKTSGQFTTVSRRDHTVVDEHPDSVLMMLWPGYNVDWAADALRRYRGDMLIYAGEGMGGCTADDDFYELLERDWKCLATSGQHVTWWGIHDALNAYVRKQRILDAPKERLAIEA